MKILERIRRGWTALAEGGSDKAGALSSPSSPSSSSSTSSERTSSGLPAAGDRPPAGLDLPLLHNEQYQLDTRSFLYGLTPERITAVFSGADTNIADQIMLAAQMESWDDHLAGTLDLRRIAVSRLPAQIIPGDPDDPRSAKAAELADALLDTPWFKRMGKWLLRAIWHQHAASEIHWGDENGMWIPRGSRAVEPARWYFDLSKEPWFFADLCQNTSNLIAPTAGRFAVHDYGAVYGQPGQYAVVQDTAKLVFLRSFALTDWGMRTDKHGQPFLHFQYQEGMSAEQIRTTINTLLTYAGRMIAATPAGTTLNMLEVNPDAPGSHLIEFCDRAISKRLLGQDTAQSALEGQRTGSQIQGEVRSDIRDDDAELLDAALNETLLAPLCAWNFGPDLKPPRIRHAARQNRDPVQTATVVREAVESGLPVGRRWAYEALGIEPPSEDDELLERRSELLVGGGGFRPGAAGSTALDRTATTAPGPLLTAQQIGSALDIMSRYREATLEQVPAVELLVGLGVDRKMAGKMLAATPRGRKDTEQDITFKREVVRGWLADGTINDVVYNRTDVDSILTACNIPLDEDYSLPWLPVQTPAGGNVTGEVITDDEGNVVGAVPEQAPAAPSPFVFGGAGIPPAREESGEQRSGGGVTPEDGRTEENIEPAAENPKADDEGLTTGGGRQSSALPEGQGRASSSQAPEEEGERTVSRAEFQAGMRSLHEAISALAAAQSDREPRAVVEDLPHRVRMLAESSSNYEEFLRRLPELMGATDHGELETAILGAECLGRLDSAARVARRTATTAAAGSGEDLPGLPGWKLEEEDPLVRRGRFSEAIDQMAQRTDLLPKKQFLELQGMARSKAWTVARVNDLAVMKDLHGAVGQAVEGGQSWREFLDSLNNVMETRGWEGLKPWHARIVYEQNVNMAYSAGRVTQARDAGVKHWRKLPSDSAVQRPEHAKFDGQIFTFEQKSPPPWAFGCKCGWEIVFDDEVEAGERSKLGGASYKLPAGGEFEWDASHYDRPLELRQGDYPRELWPVIRSLAGDKNALLEVKP